MKSQAIRIARPALAALFLAAAGVAVATLPSAPQTPEAPAAEAKEAAKTAGKYDRPGFTTILDKHGRLWVFRAESKELAEFLEKGEPAKVVIRPKAGPDGLTLKSTDIETIEAYLAAK